jgi:hypothetical protein
VSAPLLDEKILALERAFSEADIPHAFGGALALAYYATPRGTVDIDVNIFLGTEEAERVFAALEPLGVDTAGASDRGELHDRGQTRLLWEHTPLDLFFAYDPLHTSCLERSRTVPFGGDATIRILSAEDLVIFKAIFDRPKDWRDTRELLFSLAGEFDSAYTRSWLERILNADDPRWRQFEELLRSPDY